MKDENALNQSEETAERKFVTFLESDLPQLILSGPLSRKTTFTLRVDGPWSAVEARNLQKIVALHIECLVDDA